MQEPDSRSSGVLLRSDSRASGTLLRSKSSSSGILDVQEEILDDDQAQKIAQERQKLIDFLKSRGNGYFLRGWRKDFDPYGQLEVEFKHFCRTAQRLDFTIDASMLFSAKGSNRNMSLKQAYPETGALVERFQLWIKQTFGSPAEMFLAFDSTSSATISNKKFVEACWRHGFKASDKEFQELVACCDVQNAGSFAQDSVIFFEHDSEMRELQVFREKFSRKQQREKAMASVYAEALRREMPATHRLAPRPWLAENFETLPCISTERHGAWRRESLKKEALARKVFLRHLREMYGNEVRGWRRGLDPEANFAVTIVSMRRYCARTNLRIDCNALFKVLDKDCDGSLSLEEVAESAADILASFRDWAHATSGSCSLLWDTCEMSDARSAAGRAGLWPSNKKMLLSSFTDALRSLGWPSIVDANQRSLLCSSLDFHGCGFVARSDLEWLDKWIPPEWLYAEADANEWKQLANLMLRIYRHPLRAWRCLLDTQDSNRISWKHFQDACKQLKFKGNIAAAWRFLDDDLSGFITMKEYHPESAEMLSSFKEWTDTNFGSAEQTFKALDADGNGVVSFNELRRACTKLKWEGGDVRALFDALNIDREIEHKGENAGKRTITLEEMMFLDSWSSDLEEYEEKELDMQDETAAQSRETAAKSRDLHTAPPRSSSPRALRITGGFAKGKSTINRAAKSSSNFFSTARSTTSNFVATPKNHAVSKKDVAEGKSNMNATQNSSGDIFPATGSQAVPTKEAMPKVKRKEHMPEWERLSRAYHCMSQCKKIRTKSLSLPTIEFKHGHRSVASTMKKQHND